MTTPDALDLDAITALCDAATPGPWHVEIPTRGYPQRVGTDSAVLIAETFCGPEHPPAVAAFIAAARSPWMAVMSGDGGFCADTLEELAEFGDIFEIAVVRATALPTERDGGLRRPGSWESEDLLYEITHFEDDDEFYRHWARAQAVAAGLNGAADRDRLAAKVAELDAETKRLTKVLAGARAAERKTTADLLHVAWKHGVPLICRHCGHGGGSHDAGECWYTSDGPDTQCPCSFADLWPTELTTMLTTPAENGVGK